MASGFFAILDDIAALMDDVALATKMATRKTAGILGDDLAVNAEKATGFLAERELPILWAITKGSLINKLIIVPIALLLNAFAPVAITYILILGGCYLAYEGVEKIIEFFIKPKHGTPVAAMQEKPQIPAAEQEGAKVKSAITTDFILSVEIVIIALGAVATQQSMIQIITVSAVALIATVGVYGIVALIVRMDDLGYSLIRRTNNSGPLAKVGNALVLGLPVIIRVLGVVGTLALLLVAGGIFAHNIQFLHDVYPGLPDIIKEFVLGIIAGLLVAIVVSFFKRIVKTFNK
ncbi:DUF808 domain-containing protein [Dyadobacter sp. BHUBP1]|uniref:DUF808 domain-containing protein n=1 Tax=Dyadobacter sp. BHUBP1 TaxID=3424178 RepID=UPI003D345717